MKFFMILLALVCLVAIGELAIASRLSNTHEWVEYKKKYGKVYTTPEEDAKRFSLFMASKEMIQKHNTNDGAGYKMGLSQLSDWTHEELALLKGMQYDSAAQRRFEGGGGASANEQSRLRVVRETIRDPPLPAQVDWRKIAPNRVSPVKDQGKCASDWAFATTGLLEAVPGLHNRKAKLIPLSEQQLIDCSESNKGCNGGTISDALMDLIKTGIESEQDYPYTGAASKTCQFNKDKSVMKVYGPAEIYDQPDSALKGLSFLYGPVAIGVHVNGNFTHYKSGIFNDQTCAGAGGKLQNPDHAALLVGYGTDPNEGDYWLVKNSWSS
uniref:Crustapain n=1 Tax=Aceria tosichella TaxID=561515 RepID=A0A6G1SAU2_9ACAR